MSSAIIVNALAGAAVFSALIVTILHGLAYAALQSLPSHTTTTGLAPVLLSILTCVAILALSLLTHKDVRSDAHCSSWKLGMFCITGVFFFTSTISVAGTMAMNDLHTSSYREEIFIARSIFFALSALTQGLYCGFLLVTLAQRKPCPDWPRSYSQELKALPESPQSVQSPTRTLCDPYPELKQFDTRRSSLRKYPRRSNRFSGGTICDVNTHTKGNSIDTSSSTHSSPSSSPKIEHMPIQSQAQKETSTQDQPQTDPFADNGPHSLPFRSPSFRSMPSLRREAAIQLSLDSLVQPSPTASNFALDSPSGSTLTLPETYTWHSYKLPQTTAPSSVSLPSSPLPSPTFPSSESVREQNIHPLFRSNSPCPSPTPLPGSMVKASPSAGRTITQKTLSRMRSARELRSREKEDARSSEPGMWMGMGRAGYVRRSITRYEKKKGDLNELPEER